jgi:putative transposase
MGLNLPRRKTQRLRDRPHQPLDATRVINRIWSIDFMSDALYTEKRYRTLNVIDDGVREVLSIRINALLSSGRVVRTLEQIAAWRGLPRALRLDNGPELISQVLVDWCDENNMQLR